MKTFWRHEGGKILNQQLRGCVFSLVVAFVLFMFYPIQTQATNTSKDQQILNIVKADDTAAFTDLLRKGLDVNQVFDGKVLLNYAATKGALNITKMLIEEGADVNRFHDDTSPLINAVRRERKHIAMRLIANGADINLADSKGNTPFIHAARVDDFAMIKLMFEVGADFRAKNNRGKKVADYIDNLEKNPVLDYFNQMLLIHKQSDTLPDMKDGPHVFLLENEVRVEYFIHDGVKNRTWKTFRYFPVKSGTASFMGFAGDTNFYELDLRFTSEPVTVKTKSPVFAVGDLHGHLDAFQNLLESQNIIDNHHNWIWNSGHLVLTGDIFDRGKKVTESFWYIHDLSLQAKTQGGDVHLLLGNHEIMNMSGDYRYLARKYIHFLLYFRMQQSDLYGKNTYLGRWLREKNVIMKLQNKLFVHAGLSPHVINQDLSLEDINSIFRMHLNGEKYRVPYIQDLLLSAMGPVWYRGYLMGDNAGTRLRQIDVEKALEKYNADLMVIGHTEQYTIRNLYNNCVYAIDVPIGRKGYIGQGLLIVDDVVYKCGEHGSRSEFK